MNRNYLSRSISRGYRLRVILRRLATIFGWKKQVRGRKLAGWTANDLAVNDAPIIDVGRWTRRWNGSQLNAVNDSGAIWNDAAAAYDGWRDANRSQLDVSRAATGLSAVTLWAVAVLSCKLIFISNRFFVAIINDGRPIRSKLVCWLRWNAINLRAVLINASSSVVKRLWRWVKRLWIRNDEWSKSNVYASTKAVRRSYWR